MSYPYTYFTTDPLVPKYYYVPYPNIREERNIPGSQERSLSKEGSSESNIFLWGQVKHVSNEIMFDSIYYFSKKNYLDTKITCSCAFLIHN